MKLAVSRLNLNLEFGVGV